MGVGEEWGERRAEKMRSGIAGLALARPSARCTRAPARTWCYQRLAAQTRRALAATAHPWRRAPKRAREVVGRRTGYGWLSWRHRQAAQRAAGARAGETENEWAEACSTKRRARGRRGRAVGGRCRVIVDRRRVHINLSRGMPESPPSRSQSARALWGSGGLVSAEYIWSSTTRALILSSLVRS